MERTYRYQRLLFGAVSVLSKLRYLSEMTFHGLFCMEIHRKFSDNGKKMPIEGTIQYEHKRQVWKKMKVKKQEFLHFFWNYSYLHATIIYFYGIFEKFVSLPFIWRAVHFSRFGGTYLKLDLKKILQIGDFMALCSNGRIHS